MENLYNNPLVFKIQQGTPRSDINLCKTCRYSLHIRYTSGQETFRCQHTSKTLPEQVVECSFYSDKTQPTIESMQEIAWTLMTDKGGRKIGFKAPEENKHYPPPSMGF